MKKVLVIVDVQNDFCGADGSLSTPEARQIVPLIADYIRTHADKDTVLVFTKDTHDVDYMFTQEGEHLPVAHCIKDTYGWELAPAIQEALYDVRDQYDPCDTYFPYMANHVITKPTFGSLDFVNLLYALDDDYGIDEVTLMGLCTDICIFANSVLAKTTLPEIPVRVVADCCAGVTPESHQRALDAMKMLQIEII